jgi:hypothetical protein
MDSPCQFPHIGAGKWIMFPMPISGSQIFESILDFSHALSLSPFLSPDFSDLCEDKSIFVVREEYLEGKYEDR